MHGRPILFRGHSGRLELFVIDDQLLRHTYEMNAPGGGWSGWNTKGFPAPIRYEENVDDVDRPLIAVTAHRDGRLETFGRASLVDEHRLAHCWANRVDGEWNTVWHRGTGSLGSAPAAVNRRFGSGENHLLVVAVDTLGAVRSMHQDSGDDSASWTDWQPLDPTIVVVGNAGAVAVAPPRAPVHVFTVGKRRDASNPRDRVYMSVDTDPSSLNPCFGPWVELDQEVDPASRIAVLATPERIWVATRTIMRQIVCWDFAPGTRPALRVLTGVAGSDVTLGAWGDGNAAFVALRDATSGKLYGQRLSPSA
jgi:hypothetical protein